MQISGHVRKRPSKDNQPRYQITIELPYDKSTGERNRIYKTIRGTKKQAEHRMREMIMDLENHTYVKESSISVREWMDTWIDLYLKDKSPTTVAGYKKQIQTHIIPVFGNVHLQDLATVDIQKWVNGLYDYSPASNKGLKPKTVRNIFLNLHAACHKAVLLEMIKKNPCDNVILRRSESKVVDPYDFNEIQTLLNALKGDVLEVPILLDLSLGLRRGELLALRWEDVDFTNRRIQIRKNLVLDENRKLVFKTPKTKSGKRSISLSDRMCTILKNEQVRYLERKLKYGADFKDNDLVVCQSDGSPYNPDSFSAMFRRFLERNGLRHIRLHDIRHTNCTQMITNGVDMKTMQARLGHADYSVTANTYSHLLPEVDRKAAEVADSFLFGNG